MICCSFLYSVRPGRGIPPLWLFLRFLPFFFFFTLLKGFFSPFFSPHQRDPHLNRGSKDGGCCCCTDLKAHWGNVIVILGYINKIDLIWFDDYDWTNDCSGHNTEKAELYHWKKKSWIVTVLHQKHWWQQLKVYCSKWVKTLCRVL